MPEKSGQLLQWRRRDFLVPLDFEIQRITVAHGMDLQCLIYYSGWAGLKVPPENYHKTDRIITSVITISLFKIDGFDSL